MATLHTPYKLTLAFCLFGMLFYQQCTTDEIVGRGGGGCGCGGYFQDASIIFVDSTYTPINNIDSFLISQHKDTTKKVTNTLGTQFQYQYFSNRYVYTHDTTFNAGLLYIFVNNQNYNRVSKQGNHVYEYDLKLTLDQVETLLPIVQKMDVCGGYETIFLGYPFNVKGWVYKSVSLKGNIDEAPATTILASDVKDKIYPKIAFVFDKNNKKFLVPIDSNFENVINKKAIVEALY